MNNISPPMSTTDQPPPWSARPGVLLNLMVVDVIIALSIWSEVRGDGEFSFLLLMIALFLGALASIPGWIILASRASKHRAQVRQWYAMRAVPLPAPVPGEPTWHPASWIIGMLVVAAVVFTYVYNQPGSRAGAPGTEAIPATFGAFGALLAGGVATAIRRLVWQSRRRNWMREG